MPPAANVPARRLLYGASVLVGMNESSDQRGALSPEGGLFALAGGEDGVQLLDVESGRGVAWREDLACHEPDPNYVGPCEPRLAFSKDGAHLFVYWPLWKKLLRLAVPGLKTEAEAAIEGLFDLLPLDGERVVGLRSKDSVVVDADGKPQTLFAHDRYPLAVSPDGKQIAFEENDHAAIYDVETKVVVSTSPAGATQGLGFVPGGQAWIAAKSDRDGYADVVSWRADAKTIRTLASSAERLKSADGDAVEHWVFPAPYTELWVTMRKAGLVRVDLKGERSPFGPRGASVGVIRRGDEVLLQGYGCVERVDLHGALLPGIQLCGLRPFVLGFDGSLLVAHPWGKADIERYDAKSGAYVSSVAQKLPPALDHRTLSHLSRDAGLRAKVALGLALPEVKNEPFTVSEDGHWLFVGSRSSPRDAAVIDLEAMKARTKLLSFVAAGDGSVIVQDQLDSSRAFDVRRVRDDRRLRTISLDIDPIYLQLSHDGKRLVAQDTEKTVVVDVVTGKKLFEPACRSSYNGYFEFSKDGSILVCDRLQETVLYGVPSGKLLRRFRHPVAEAADAFALSDDRSQLAIAAGALRIYRL